jgi:predicted nucleotidyltransferase
MCKCVTIGAEVVNMTLRELRLSKGLTQKQAAELCSVSLRSYVTFENDESKTNTIKYKYLVSVLEQYGIIDETHGILTVDEIRSALEGAFEGYSVSYCYLFGSYSKGTATESSDVDLLISADVTGMKFFGLVDKVRDALHKKVDVLDPGQLKDNPDLLNEILKDGVKVYG